MNSQQPSIKVVNKEIERVTKQRDNLFQIKKLYAEILDHDSSERVQEELDVIFIRLHTLELALEKIEQLKPIDMLKSEEKPK